ncbi:MAG: MBOAT family protein [Firmicutes bacterium]|nr:MBOAT family protein [Bacillota bacterium]
MVFSSAIFLFSFLPILLLAYFIVPAKAKNYVLLAFSMIFYAFGGPKYLVVLLFVVLVDYIGARLIEKKRDSAKKVLTAVIAVNLATLIFYKYTMFFLENLSVLFQTDLEFFEVIMPIGISFYTFQSMSYVIDVYRREVAVQKNYLLLLLYVSLFPQLVAGPIVRYQTIEHEIHNRKSSIDDICYGIERFILGFAKKIIIANQMGMLADIVFDGGTEYTPVAWLGAIAYMFQIYFDFSAYSDMAIGLGRIFGFHFLENFNFPYVSKSIKEFWSRWHISLSTWFRDYVYIPLGGNRCSAGRHFFNMAVVWALTGFWHGAEWTFLFWGLYYFVFLAIEKFIIKDKLDNIPTVLRHIGTLLIVLIGWVLFRAEDMGTFTNMVGTMFSFNFDAVGMAEARLYIETYFVYFIGAIIFSTPIYYKICGRFENSKVFAVIKYGGLLVLMLVSVMFLAHSSYNPFIYFRF